MESSVINRALQRLISMAGRRTPLPKWRLLGAYITIRLKQLFLVKLLRLNIARESVFGRTAYFYNYSTFAFLFEEIFIEGAYAFRPARKRPTIIDCGANVGMSVLFFSLAYPGCRIVAFEPDSDNYRALQQTCAQLRNVIAIEKAVCAVQGVRDFYYYPHYPGSLRTSLQRERLSSDLASRPVQCVQLSESITDEIDLLKVDVEGAEQEVLEEVARAGKLRLVREMVVEYHHHLIREEDKLAETLALLEREGFGYDISQPRPISFDRGMFQDILIHAYRK